MHQTIILKLNSGLRLRKYAANQIQWVISTQLIGLIKSYYYWFSFAGAGVGLLHPRYEALRGAAQVSYGVKAWRLSIFTYLTAENATGIINNYWIFVPVGKLLQSLSQWWMMLMLNPGFYYCPEIKRFPASTRPLLTSFCWWQRRLCLSPAPGDQTDSVWRSVSQSRHWLSSRGGWRFTRCSRSQGEMKLSWMLGLRCLMRLTVVAWSSGCANSSQIFSLKAGSCVLLPL